MWGRIVGNADRVLLGVWSALVRIVVVSLLGFNLVRHVLDRLEGVFGDVGEDSNVPTLRKS